MSDSNNSTDTSVSTLDPPLDAFAHAMAIESHTHAAALGKEADAPRQAELPLPRPPFDLVAELRKLDDKEDEIDELKAVAGELKAAFTAARKEYEKAQEAVEDADQEYRAMRKAFRRARRDAEAGVQLELTHGRECAYERSTGQVCSLCAEERERFRNAQVAAALAADAPADTAVMVRQTSTGRYLAVGVGVGQTWDWILPGAGVPWKFPTEEEARINLAGMGVEADVEIIPEATYVAEPELADAAEEGGKRAGVVRDPE